MVCYNFGDAAIKIRPKFLHGNHNGEQLFLMGRIVTFRTRKLVRKVSNGLQTVSLVLLQYGTNCLIACIGFEYKLCIFAQIRD